MAKTRTFIKEFPVGRQLSLMGLERYIEYDRIKEYVINLAHKRLRRALKAKGALMLAWGEATAIADTDLLKTLHSYGKVECWREAPPWMVIVR